MRAGPIVAVCYEYITDEDPAFDGCRTIADSVCGHSVEEALGHIKAFGLPLENCYVFDERLNNETGQTYLWIGREEQRRRREDKLRALQALHRERAQWEPDNVARQQAALDGAIAAMLEERE